MFHNLFPPNPARDREHPANPWKSPKAKGYAAKRRKARKTSHASRSRNR